MTMLNGEAGLPEFRPHSVHWTSEKVLRTWDFYAQHPVEFFSSTYSASLATIVSGECGNGPVADIGCGTGDLVGALVAKGIRVVGVDSSSGIIAVARQRLPTVEFHVAPGTALPFGDQALSGAVLVEVVEHLDDQTLQDVLAEARRVIRRGGKLIITTPNDEDIGAAAVQCPDCGCRFHPMQHVRRWTAASLRGALAESGFTPTHVLATELVPNGSRPGRWARKVYYGVRRRRLHLVGIGARR